VASQAVCITNGPEVCVRQADEVVLDDLAEPAQRILSRMAGVPGAPTRVEWSKSRERQDTLYLQFVLQPTLTGSLVEDDVIESVAAEVTYQSRGPCIAHAGPDFEFSFRADTIVKSWLMQKPSPEYGSAQVVRPLDALYKRDIGAQRDWMARYLAANKNCDYATLRSLVES
jgi:hypothetical protein